MTPWPRCIERHLPTLGGLQVRLFIFSCPDAGVMSQLAIPPLRAGDRPVEESLITGRGPAHRMANSVTGDISLHRKAVAICATNAPFCSSML